jgi:dihydrofolate synthase/folylpolyglutamate synthase
MPVFENKAAEMNAPLYFASQNIDNQLITTNFDNSNFNVFYKNQLFLNELKVNLSGDFQIKNVATVLQTVKILQTMPPFSKITEGVIRAGLGNVKTLTKFIGRWQTIGKNPTILCDSGHNEGGLKLTLNELKQLKYSHLHIVFGMVKDKDPSKVLSLLPTGATYYFCKANIPRGLDAESLKNTANNFNLKGKAYPSVRRALAAAKLKARQDDLIFVGGSIFVVAEVL